MINSEKQNKLNEIRASKINKESLVVAYVYLTVKQFCIEYPAFTEGGLRFQIFNEKINGLARSGAIVRMGRKILIKPALFFAWLEGQNGEPE
jgi:hypothetical protein